MTEYKIADFLVDAPHEPSGSVRQPQLRTPPSALPTPSVSQSNASPPPVAPAPEPSATFPVNPPIHESINPSLHHPTTAPLHPSAPLPQPLTLNSLARPSGATAAQPSFPRSPGETPRAYNAFITFFQLGQARSHQSVADTLGENLGTIRNWSSRFDWSGRLQVLYSGLLQQQLQAQAETQARHAVDWTLRLDRFREQEWDAAQKLLAAAQCFLESFGEEDLEKMTLAQVSRALKISSTIGRLALAGAELPPSSEASLSPVQHQLLNAINRVYGVGRAVPSAPHLSECATAQAPDSRGLAGDGSSSSSSTTPSQPSTLNLS